MPLPNYSVKKVSEKRALSTLVSTGIVAVAIIGLVVGYTFLAVTPGVGHTTTTLTNTETVTEPAQIITNTQTQTVTQAQTTVGGTQVATQTTTLTQTTTQTASTTTTAVESTTTTYNDNLLSILLLQNILNATSQTWTVTLENLGNSVYGPSYNSFPYSVEGTLNYPPSTYTQIAYISMNIGIGQTMSETVPALGLYSGGTYCITLNGTQIGSTEAAVWSWHSCYVPATG